MLAMKAIAGWIVPDRNWALKLAWKSSSFSLVERVDGLLLAAERLDDGVPGVHLLDVAVERRRSAPTGRRTASATAWR